MTDPISRPFAEDQFVEGLHQLPQLTRKPDELRKARIDEATIKGERERNDLAMVLQTEPGQAFVMRLLALCGVTTSTFDSSHAVASFKEGQRDIGLKVLKDICTIDPELYPTLLVNHVKRQRRLASVQPIV